MAKPHLPTLFAEPIAAVLGALRRSEPGGVAERGEGARLSRRGLGRPQESFKRIFLEDIGVCLYVHHIRQRIGLLSGLCLGGQLRVERLGLGFQVDKHPEILVIKTDVLGLKRSLEASIGEVTPAAETQVGWDFKQLRQFGEGWIDAAASVGVIFFWCLAGKRFSNLDPSHPMPWTRGTIFYFIAWYCYISCLSTVPVRWAASLYQVVKSPEKPHLAGKPLPVQGPAVLKDVDAPKGCAKACTVPQMAKLLACVGHRKAPKYGDSKG